MANKSIKIRDGSDVLYPESAVTGSNSNGTYIKFADGTLIQYGTTTISVSLSQIASTGVYYQSKTLNMPLSFASTTYTISGSSRYSTGHILPIGGVANTVSQVNICIYDFYARSGNVSVRWMAVGKWK